MNKVTVPSQGNTAMITIADRRKKERRADFRLLEQFMYVENDRRQDFSDSEGGNTQENRQGATRRDGEDRRMIGGSGAFINPDARNMGHGYSIEKVWDEFTHDAVLLRDGRYIAITTGEDQFMQLSIYRDEDHFNEPYSSTVPLATVLINEDGHIDVSYDKNHRKVNS